MPYLVYIYVFHNILGLSLLASQMSLYFVLLAMGGVSMYYFFINQSWFTSSNFSQLRFGALSAAVIYMFNPYSMAYLWQDFSLETFLYAIVPILLLLVQRGLAKAAKGDSIWGSVLAISVVTIFAAPALGIPAFSIPLVLGIAVFCLLWLISPVQRSHRITSLRFLAITTAVLLLVHSWWVYPTLKLFRAQLVSAGGTFYGSVGLADILANSIHTNYFNVFRIAGIVAFYRDSAYPHYDFAWVYQTPFLPETLLSLAVPVTAFSALLLKDRALNRTTVLFAALCVLLIIPLAAGTQPPFGAIYEWLAFNLPAAAVLFRDPYQKFGYWIPFGYSFLIGVTFLSLALGSSRIHRSRFQRLTNKIPTTKTRVRILSVFLILITVGTSWPMFTGDLIPKASPTVPSARIDIPDYYLQAASWLRSEVGDFRVLSLPKDQILQSSSWRNGYAGQDILRFLTGDSIISTDPLVPDLLDFQIGLYNYIMNGGSNLEAPLRILNVRYVMLRLDAGFYPAVTLAANLTSIRLYLDSQPGLELSHQFGSLVFYRVQAEGPRIFASSQLYSPTDLSKTGWTLSQHNGDWKTSSLNMSTTQSGLRLELVSPRTYSYGYATISRPLNVSLLTYPYLSLRFSSSTNAAILLRISTQSQSDIWLSASRLGQAVTYGNNQYSSVNPTTIVYDLFSIPGIVTSLDIFLSNLPLTNSTLTSIATIYGLSFDSFLTRPRDYVGVIARIGGDPLSYAIADDNMSLGGNPGLIAPTISYHSLSPVEYQVQVVNATQPFLLTFAETFSPLWTVIGNPSVVASTVRHVMVDGYANGWMIDSQGTYTIRVRYSIGSGFLLPYYSSLLSFFSLLGITIYQRRRSMHRFDPVASKRADPSLKPDALSA